ncbi:MAG: fatty acid desaturase [Planctomycetes bacterium]|nr:fatty acid desaturase [Planctomycetota bacterium]
MIVRPRSEPEQRASDRPLVIALLAHAAFLLCAPPWWGIALAFWWNANAVAHPFVHRPFFAAPRANALWSLASSLVLLVPQELWRQRHLAHHAGRAARVRWNARLRRESAALAASAALLAFVRPDWLLWHVAPGLGVGLALCALHGHYEHARGTTNWRSRLGNRLFFNDGYHAEHHAHPRAHWSALPRLAQDGVPCSRWPAALRWMEALTSASGALDALERLALRSRSLRGWLVRVHERALRDLAGELGTPRRIAIVGGGLFPRSALALARVFPRAELTVIDLDAEHLERARPTLPAGTRAIHARFDPARHRGFDLVVLPLALRGAKDELYERPPARHLLVHDWLWRRRGRGVAISLLLLKRLNLVSAPLAATSMEERRCLSSPSRLPVSPVRPSRASL